MEDLLPLSALQHLVFCPRQCALIHIEREWADNRLTVEGNLLHERVTEGETSRRGDRVTWRSLPLVCHRLGLIGYADTVEIEDAASGGPPVSVRPVEYKRGKTKPHDADRVQLCAQALCLEEMFGLPIAEGDLFYGEPRRRETVPLTADLRRRTEALAVQLRDLLESRLVPAAEPGPKCRSCSLTELCRPTLAGLGAVAAYLDDARRKG